MQLRAVVVEARRRVANSEAQGFQLEYVVAFEIANQALDPAARYLATTTKFAKSNVTVISLDFNNRSHKPPPVRSVTVQQRRFQRHRDWRRANVGNPAWFHFILVVR